MSPIESAARALCQEFDGNPDDEVTVADGHQQSVALAIPGNLGRQPRWRKFVPAARAAVAAIREPSETMMKAAREADAVFHVGPEWAQWEIMLEAGLREGP